MNIIVLNNVIPNEVKKTIVKQVVKYGMKVAAGIACEVTIHFASKKIIEIIEEEQEAKAQNIVEFETN